LVRMLLMEEAAIATAFIYRPLGADPAVPYLEIVDVCPARRRAVTARLAAVVAEAAIRRSRAR
jgi:hypothetical protein